MVGDTRRRENASSLPSSNLPRATIQSCRLYSSGTVPTFPFWVKIGRVSEQARYLMIQYPYLKIFLASTSLLVGVAYIYSPLNWNCYIKFVTKVASTIPYDSEQTLQDAIGSTLKANSNTCSKVRSRRPDGGRCNLMLRRLKSS